MIESLFCAFWIFDYQFVTLSWFCALTFLNTKLDLGFFLLLQRVRLHHGACWAPPARYAPTFMGSVLGHLVDWIDTICKTTKLASGDCLVENLHTWCVIDLGSKTPMLGADNNLELPMSYFLDTHLGEHFQLGPASLVCVELHLAVTVKALEVFDLVNLDRRGWATLDTTNNAPRTPAIVSFQQWDNINPSLWNRPGPADTTVASLLNMWRGGRFRFQPAHGLGS